MVSSPPAPSTFAALLRRSKFASYDPLIGQVYTSYGGHAHRGDWGVKRPLPNRHRDACIRLRNVDTIYQHTDWKNAWKDTSFVKNFRELNVEPKVSLYSQWQAMRSGPCEDLWTADTDFDMKSSVGKRKAEQALFWEKMMRVPDVRAMSTREFARFIRRVRKLRPEFSKFLKERTERLQDRSMMEASEWSSTSNMEADLLRAENAHVHFLSDQSKRTALADSSRSILQLPHRNAGLSYAQIPQLQSLLFARPQPGRVVVSGPDGLEHWPVVGGFKGQPTEQHNHYKQNSGDTNRNHGKPEVRQGMWRTKDAAVIQAPITVGRFPQSVGPTRMRIKFEDWKVAENEHAVPHLPGSRTYNGSADLRGRKANDGRTMLSYPRSSPVLSPKNPMDIKKETETNPGDLIRQLRDRVSAGALESVLTDVDKMLPDHLY